MEPIEIILKYPVDHAGEKITKLAMRPVKAKDLRRLRSSTDDKLKLVLELAGLISGQTEEVIDELMGEDLMEVMDAVNLFFPSGPETGETD